MLTTEDGFSKHSTFYFLSDRPLGKYVCKLTRSG